MTPLAQMGRRIRRWLQRLCVRNACPICLVPLAEHRQFCSLCLDTLDDLAWQRQLRNHRSSEGVEE